MIDFLNLSKYHAFCLLPVVCGNVLAAESEGSTDAAMYAAVKSNLAIYVCAMVCCWVIYRVYKSKQSKKNKDKKE